MAKRRTIQGSLLLAVLVAAAGLLAVVDRGDGAQASGTAPELSIEIDVDGGGADCDTRPSTGSIGTGCTVPVGGSFTVRTHIDTFAAPPPSTGYIVFQVRLLYSTTGLDLLNRTGAGELGTPMYWNLPCNLSQAEVPNDGSDTGNYFIDCWNSGPGVSLLERDESDNDPDGKLVEVDFACTSAGQRFMTLDDSSQLHNQNHASLFEKDADETLLINCKDSAIDTDGDTVPNGTDVDDDADGCDDDEEQGSSKTLGGQRNPHNFWDLFDVWTGTVPNMVRNQAVAAPDINNVISRFGASGAATSVADALTEPSSSSGYHAAYDRGPVIGSSPWHLGPANGSVAATDINAVIAQFGDNCLAA
jgi:hypothetical protein